MAYLLHVFPFPLFDACPTFWPRTHLPSLPALAVAAAATLAGACTMRGPWFQGETAPTVSQGSVMGRLSERLGHRDSARNGPNGENQTQPVVGNGVAL